tara:strand:- start:305 stop:1063 length:759 start_codon:yes stop_codon:yes gene_type:complete
MELIIYITQMDDKAIEGLIIMGVLLLILIIGSLIPSKKQNLKSEEEEEEEKYLESVVDQFKASIRLINLKNMQKRSGKNYSKSINRQKKLINSLKRKQKTKKIKLELKTNFKNISHEEKVKILESSLLKRLLRRTKDSMSSRIAKRDFMYLVSKESVKYYLGCSFNDFINYLELYFNDNLNWSNYDEWHLDHIIPISSAENVDEFNALQHYKNIQPLFGVDNVKKSSKYDEDEKFSYLEWYYNNIALPDFKD